MRTKWKPTFELVNALLSVEKREYLKPKPRKNKVVANWNTMKVEFISDNAVRFTLMHDETPLLSVDVDGCRLQPGDSISIDGLRGREKIKFEAV